MITVSVPGKVNIMGEHAVVYGMPSLLAAVNLRLTVSVEPFPTFEIISGEPTEYVRYAAEFLSHEYQIPELPHVKITIRSDIPAGYHLGSSAAVVAGTIAALMYYLKKVWNPATTNQFAYEVEKKQHGNPSGGDNTTVTMGGLIWFRKELEFLKSIWQLPFTLPSSLNHFYLIDTGRPKETTGEMVAYVHSQYAKYGAKYNKLFDKNEHETKRITVAIKERDEHALIDAIRMGERTLEGMGVVSRSVIPLIRKIEKAGGAAKILGGGGRTSGTGYLLCYGKNPPGDAKAISLGTEGLRLERKT